MNNSEKNTFVKNRITETFIKLLEQKRFDEISICEITDCAQVSRNSFYRNYSKKEDILVCYIEQLLREWGKVFETDITPTEQWCSLFGHLNEHRDFYTLLSNRGLISLLRNALIKTCGPRPEHSNVEAYAAAFVANALYGWIEEWVKRGMTESAEEMTVLLKATGFGAAK